MSDHEGFVLTPIYDQLCTELPHDGHTPSAVTEPDEDTDDQRVSEIGPDDPHIAQTAAQE
jgi:hypothetical protein